LSSATTRDPRSRGAVWRSRSLVQTEAGREISASTSRRVRNALVPRRLSSITWPSTQTDGARSMCALSFWDSSCNGHGFSGLVSAAVAGTVVVVVMSSDTRQSIGGTWLMHGR
jgi:hypothetical protein